LVSGHESGILEGACHEDLALLILGSLVASGVAVAYFWVNFDFAQRRERHVHRNHVVRAVSLIEDNGKSEQDPISSPIDVEFGCALSRDIP
jgi:hypothetical protein